MWHGQFVRLHPGTVCHLSAPNREYDAEPIKITKFNGAKMKWQIELQSERFKGKELLVPESSLRLSFCVLPESMTQCNRVAKFVDDMQGSCGRGLIAGETIMPGSTLFEEPPLVLTPVNVQRVHEDRWRAYVTMMYGQHQSPAIAAALQAFDDLGIADKVPTSLEVAAATILNQALKSAGQKAMDSEDRAQHEKKVVDSLMRFQSNQFKYDNAFSKAEGFKDDVAVKYSAAAVFRFTSRLNHSCSPSAFVETKKSAHTPGKLVAGDGVLVCKALTSMSKGDRITLNYGPQDLPGWDLKKRRAYLSDKCGFVCGCEKCVQDETASSAAVDAGMSALAELEAAEKEAAAVVEAEIAKAPVSVEEVKAKVEPEAKEEPKAKVEQPVRKELPLFEKEVLLTVVGGVAALALLVMYVRSRR